MDIDRNSLIALAMLLITLITIVALVRNAPVTLKMVFGKDKSLILEGTKPLSISETGKIDCLPLLSKENSQLCDKE